MTRPGRRLVGAVLAGILLVSSGCTAAPAHVRGLSDPFVLPPYEPAAGPDDTGLSEPVSDPLYPAYGNPALDVLRYQLNLA